MAIEGCPSGVGYWIDRRTGVRRPRSCGRLGCGYCGPRLALSTANAIALARPHSSAVLVAWDDGVPEKPDALFRFFAKAILAVAEKLRADGLVWEWAWTLELSETGIPNAHLLQRGDVVSPSKFRRAALDAGLSWADIQPIRHVPLIARYILKLPLAPLDLGLDGEACMALHLALNRGRLVHASRGFWTDGSRRLPGVRVARVRARMSPGSGRRPTTEELAEWRAGWRLPDLRTFVDDRNREDDGG